MTGTRLLEGIKVLDFGRVLVAPYLTQMLVDLGAEVYKIERPGGADERHLSPFKDGRSGYSMTVNRGKKSICIDLGMEAGRDTIRDFISKVDIIVENFRPKVVDRLGFGYTEASKINPGIIMLSVSCFGQTGALSKRPGYDIIAQASSGLMWLTGYEGAQPQRNGTSIGDVNCSAHAGMAICAALLHRDLTGKGQQIDMSLRDCLCSTLDKALVENAVSQGAFPEGRRGNRDKGKLLYGVFEGPDQRYFAIGAERRSHLTNLCQLLGIIGQLEGDASGSDTDFVEYLELIETEFTSWMSNQTSTASIVDCLKGSGIPATEVLNIAELVEEPVYLSRHNIVETDDPNLGKVRLPATPFGSLTNATGQAVTTPTPVLGQHTESVLEELLGYTPDKIRSLKEEGVVFDEKTA